MEIRENQIGRVLNITIVTIFLIITLCLLLFSCVAPESLTEPHPRDYKIVKVTPKKVWVTDCGEDTPPCLCDTIPLRNRGDETMVVGGYLLDKYRKTYER